MLQDPEVFPDPEELRPERFLNADGTRRELERHEDPSVIGFGFGRRCVASRARERDEGADVENARAESALGCSPP